MEIVMSKVITKTAEMLAQFDEQEKARLVSATLAMDSGEDEVAEAIATIARELGSKPSWARYSMGRLVFVETLEAQGKTEDAIKSKWKRVCRESAMTIPESDDPEAKRKAEQRAKALAVFANTSTPEIQAEMANLLSNPTLKNIDEAKKLGKELERRSKEAQKDTKSELAEVRKAIREQLDLVDEIEFLREILAQLRA
jgi:hypothetical protein